MQVTVNSYLNARSGSASTKAPNPLFLRPGDSLSIDDSVVGEEIEGNCVWYHSTDGNYYWSGGVQDTDFLFGDKDFKKLETTDKVGIINSLKNEKYDFFRQKIRGMTGCGIGFKNDKRILCLSVYVQSKLPEDQLEFSLPETISYKGWSIPTDVKTSGRPVTHDYNPAGKDLRLQADNIPLHCGGSISPLGKTTFGTRTVKVLADGQLCALTCFHVLFGPFVTNSNPVQYPGIEDLKDQKAIYPGTKLNPDFSGPIQAEILKGQYDGHYDFALVKISNVQLKNVILNGDASQDLRITGFYEEKELTTGTRLNIRSFGATSGPQSGVITDFKHNTDITLNGVVRTYYDLLVSEKIAEPGDSGAPVIGPDNRMVGYVVAGTATDDTIDSPKTYIMPWYNLYHNQNLTLAP